MLDKTFNDLTPLSAQISASNFHDLTQITQRRVCFNPKRTVKPKARGGRGVNRKHHPAERCDLRFGFQSARKNLKSHSAAPRVISNFSVRFEPNLKSHLSAG